MRVALLAGIVGLAAAALGYALGVLVALPFVRRALRLGGSSALALRLLPSTAALVAAGVLTVPGFALYEPARADERPGLSVVLLAAGGLLLVASTARRAVFTWRATRRLLARWRRTARPLARPCGPTPAFRIADPFPVVAVVGVLRPRLYLARSVLRALTPGELSAVLEHEAAHVAARDNLKRWLLACAPSVGWRGAAQRLETAWEQAAEHDADRGSRSALELASALVKAARLAPRGPGLRVPAVAFHTGGDVARRIRALVEDSERAPRGRRGVHGALLAAAAAGAASLPVAWPLAHRWAETLIHLP
jgi:Zn-dependent protease with chaperone function